MYQFYTSIYGILHATSLDIDIWVTGNDLVMNVMFATTDECHMCGNYRGKEETCFSSFECGVF